MANSGIIKVAALTSGKNVPSTRFRIRQHIEPLRNFGIDVREYVPAIDKYASFPFQKAKKYIRPISMLWHGLKLSTRIPGIIGSWNAQITWLEREIFPGYLTFEPLLKSPYVLDVDDAVWLLPPYGRQAMVKIAKNAEAVLAGNAYIAEWFSSYARDVRIVPTAVDTDRFVLGTDSDMQVRKRYVIGWSGSSGNYEYIYEIETALARFLKNHEAELLVIADKPPSFQQIDPEKVRYMRWSPEVEVEALRQMDVGLMPLPLDEWTLGKCSFKMLLYMATGKPVVVSPIGMNAEILSMGRVGFSAKSEADWYDALEYLYKDRSFGHECGLTGRMIVEKHFSRTVVSAQIARVFKELTRNER